MSRRVVECPKLLIKEIAASVGQRIAAGRNIINLSQGVPCMPTFESSEQEMINLIKSRNLPYTPVPGLDTVRETAARFVNHFYKAPTAFTKDHIIVTAGGIQACYLVSALMVESPADVVLTTLPAYSLYQTQTAYFGGSFVTMGTSNEGTLSADTLRAAFRAERDRGRRVRVVVLCNPNNPTGHVMTPDEARDIAAALEV